MLSRPSAAAEPAKRSTAEGPRFLTRDEWKLVDALCELILPDTDTPGARAAGVPGFIDDVLAESDADDQKAFRGGLSAFDSAARRSLGVSFTQAAPDRQAAFAIETSSALDRATTGASFTRDLDAQFAVVPTVDWSRLAEGERPRIEWFLGLKLLTLQGFSTSEVGRRALGIPEGWAGFFHGDYAGCEHPGHHED